MLKKVWHIATSRPSHRVVMLLAPGGDQRNAQQVLDELPVHLLIAHDVGMVMQSLAEVRRAGQAFP